MISVIDISAPDYGVNMAGIHLTQKKIDDFIIKENGKRKLHEELIIKLKKAGLCFQSEKYEQ